MISTPRRKDAERTLLDKRENQIAAVVVDAAIEVHRTLGGPGLLENVYEKALVWELGDR